MTSISVRSLSRRFGHVDALRDISFELAAGEHVMVAGPSGSGKTTLLRLIAGLEIPDSGEIFLDGASSRNIPPHQRRIGFVFQSLALWPHMTVAENIAFGIPGDARRVEELLAQIELSGYGSRYPDELSGGEAQRVALARALAPRCRILLLDEPLSHLDGPLQWRMLDLILASARDSRATLVYVSHNPEESSRVSPRILRLHAGRLVEPGTTAR